MNTSKACSTLQLSEMVRGQNLIHGAWLPWGGVLGHHAEPGFGLVPKSVQPVGRRCQAGLVEEIDVPRAFGPVRDQLGALELREMPGDGGAADRELGRQLTDATRTIGESENQLAPLGVAESFKSEIGKCGSPIA